MQNVWSVSTLNNGKDSTDLDVPQDQFYELRVLLLRLWGSNYKPCLQLQDHFAIEPKFVPLEAILRLQV